MIYEDCEPQESLLNGAFLQKLQRKKFNEDMKNQASITIKRIRYEPYEIGAKSYPFYCGCCDLNSGELCLDPNCPLEKGVVFKKSEKSLSHEYRRNQ